MKRHKQFILQLNEKLPVNFLEKQIAYI